MKVCNVVKNSVWYDPRVRKQIFEYLNNGVELCCVGMKEPRYNEEEVKKIPCIIHLVETSSQYYGRKRNLYLKMLREYFTNRALYNVMVRSGADIIHANDLNALIPAYKASKKLKCKLIYDTHEIFIENPWIIKNKIVKFIWECFERHIIKKVDKVVCVSNAAAEYLSNKYNIEKPIVVTNCVRAAQRVGLPVRKSGKLEVLNHGQFYEGRGYDIMIDAAKYLYSYEDIELVIRGFGSMEAALKQKVADEHITNFRFAPPVKVDELISEAAQAWVGVAITEAISTNFELSVSNKLYEYAAAGLPVIMSDIPEHKYLNGKYGFGIVLENNSPECFAAAVERLYKNPGLYSTCAYNAGILSDEVTWESEFKKLLDVEIELMSGH